MFLHTRTFLHTPVSADAESVSAYWQNVSAQPGLVSAGAESVSVYWQNVSAKTVSAGAESVSAARVVSADAGSVSATFCRTFLQR